MSEATKLFKALSDETRLRILHLICRRELCVCQIVDVLGIGQSKASRHLAHLRNTGLVNDRREGLWMYYSLADPNGTLHKQIIAWIKEAEDEVPMGTADLAALGDLGEPGNLCSGHTLSKEDERCDDVATVGS